MEIVPWDGHKNGTDHLEAKLNDFAEEGWKVVSVVPVRAGASAKSLIAASGTADTTELAVVLRQ